MRDLAGHLGTVDKTILFDALERAATRVGLALFVVHVSATPPIVVYASQALAEFVGRPIEELVGRPAWALVAPADQDRVRETIASRGPGAPPITMEVKVERPDGTAREIEVGVARITTPGAELAVCYFRDTTDQHEAVAAQHRSEARFRSLIENAPDGVVILQQGRIVLANSVAVRMLGVADFESIRGRVLLEFLPEADGARAMQRIGQLLAGAAVEPSEYRLRHNDIVAEVHSVVCEHAGKPAILTFVRDVTERRRMQDQLFHADRLAALGAMAATVAHEINNPLTYLQLNLQRLQLEAAAEADPARAAVYRECLANALHGVERVARITRDLRTYARDHDGEPEGPVDVIEVVDRALQMVEHDLRHRAQLVRRNPDEPAMISGTAGRLEQVVVNLLVNAIQAFDGDDSARNVITLAIAVDAGHVTIHIGDTGPGLADPERAFDPFFTTKPMGEGTGLGLTISKQLVERMGGRIEVVTTSSRGTELAVMLPRGRLQAARSAPPTTHVAGERLRILVIDDEARVREAIAELLTTEHDVDSAADGESALALLDAGDYHVILCDLMMPRMNGRDLYEQIRVRKPGLERRVVFITGGAFVPALATFLESVTNLKLRKPFTAEHVLALVQQARHHP